MFMMFQRLNPMILEWTSEPQFSQKGRNEKCLDIVCFDFKGFSSSQDSLHFYYEKLSTRDSWSLVGKEW